MLTWTVSWGGPQTPSSDLGPPAGLWAACVPPHLHKNITHARACHDMQGASDACIWAEVHRQLHTCVHAAERNLIWNALGKTIGHTMLPLRIFPGCCMQKPKACTPACHSSKAQPLRSTR